MSTFNEYFGRNHKLIPPLISAVVSLATSFTGFYLLQIGTRSADIASLVLASMYVGFLVITEDDIAYYMSLGYIGIIITYIVTFIYNVVNISVFLFNR